MADKLLREELEKAAQFYGSEPLMMRVFMSDEGEPVIRIQSAGDGDHPSPTGRPWSQSAAASWIAGRGIIPDRR